jgi:adenylate cyclase
MTDEVIYEFGPFVLEAAERRLNRGSTAIKLTPKAFNTLLLLVRHAGHIVSKDAILSEVWADTFVEEGTLTQNISVLRKALGNEPQYIETVSKGGYRFVAPVKASRPSSTGRAVERSLAVLPLVDCSDSVGEAYFADGMTEALITTLARIESLRVISRSSVSRYREGRPAMREIATALGADLALDGSVARAGSRVRIAARLVDARADAHLWADSYERDLSDILALQSDIARRIARAVELTLTPQDERRLAARPVHPDAYDAYLRGRYLWNRRTPEGFREGLNWFERAMALDSRYALVYARVADCYAAIEAANGAASSEATARAAESARRALDIDDTLAEAHASLGLVKFRVDWDWTGAEREMRRALELNPMSAASHHLYGLFLASSACHPEASIEITRAREIDPATFVLNTTAARVPYLGRRFDDALRMAEDLLASDEAFVQARVDWALAAVQAGRGREAVAVLEPVARASDPSNETLAALGVAYAKTGRRAEADRVARALGATGPMGAAPFYLAGVAAALDDPQRALDQLERAYEDRSGLLVYLGVDPIFDGLREDPGFLRLLRAVGVPL